MCSLSENPQSSSHQELWKMLLTEPVAALWLLSALDMF